MAYDMVRHVKSTIVRCLSRWLTSLAPTNEESAWAQWGKNLRRKKIISQLLVMWHVWLVWILTTKQKFMKRVENFERYVSSLAITCWFVNQTVFVLLCSLVILDLFFKRFYSPDIYPFQLFLHWTLIVCSFVFEWRNLLGIWNDARLVFILCGMVFYGTVAKIIFQVFNISTQYSL